MNVLILFDAPAQILNFSSRRNVFSLLARREVSPRTKCLPRWQWGDASKRDAEFSFAPQGEAVIDAKRGLFSWYLHGF